MASPDDLFFKDLAVFDPQMAERWKTATGGKLATTITDKMMVDIVGPIFQTGKITATQAQALNLFYNFTWQKMSKDAWAILYVGIEDAYTLDFFFRGSNVQFSTEAQLADVNAALGSAAGQIDFTSPGTHLTYSSDQYTGIQQLIKTGQISVFEVDAAWMHAQSGLYRSDIDRLVLYKGPPPLSRKFMVIHEATHAIQDWMDVVTKHKYIEADAYIAQAAAALAIDKKTLESVKEYDAQPVLAQMVLDKKAKSSNKAWTKAYTDLVHQVSKDPIYVASADLPFKPAKSEKGKNEKKTFLDLLTKMKKTPPKP